MDAIHDDGMISSRKWPLFHLLILIFVSQLLQIGVCHRPYNVVKLFTTDEVLFAQRDRFLLAVVAVVVVNVDIRSTDLMTTAARTLTANKVYRFRTFNICVYRLNFQLLSTTTFYRVSFYRASVVVFHLLEMFSAVGILQLTSIGNSSIRFIHSSQPILSIIVLIFPSRILSRIVVQIY